MIPDKVRIAFLGCGTITRTQHLPAALSHPGIEIVGLIDSDGARAEALARACGIKCSVSSNYPDAIKSADAVVNALPNSFHAPVNLDLLSEGKHVLCEKPLATNSADARACAQLAKDKGVILSVGMNRRFDSSHRLLHCVLRDGQIGNVRSYDWQYGGVFEWKSASAFYFSREIAGGGVLMDFGVHLLDSLVSWFGPITAVDYQDDDWGGGIEANCILDLQHDGEYGPVRGRVQLSRTVALRNRLLVEGTIASAEIQVSEPDAVRLHRNLAGVPVTDSIRAADESGKSSFYKQLDNFVQSILGKQKPEVDAWQAVQTVELIENCYSHRRRIPEPWSELDTEVSTARA